MRQLPRAVKGVCADFYAGIHQLGQFQQLEYSRVLSQRLVIDLSSFRDGLSTRERED